MSENKKQNDPSQRGKVECDTGDTRSNFLQSCSPPVRNVTHPLTEGGEFVNVPDRRCLWPEPKRYYEFTREEIKALEECDKESFYHRCIPFSALFATTTYAAIKYGFLKKNPELGVFPKVLVAFLLGHFYGRYAYIPHCEEKLRNLPADSRLGNVMRHYYSERLKQH